MVLSLVAALALADPDADADASRLYGYRGGFLGRPYLGFGRGGFYGGGLRRFGHFGRYVGKRSADSDAESDADADSDANADADADPSLLYGYGFGGYPFYGRRAFVYPAATYAYRYPAVYGYGFRTYGCGTRKENGMEFVFDATVSPRLCRKQ